MKKYLANFSVSGTHLVGGIESDRKDVLIKRVRDLALSNGENGRFWVIERETCEYVCYGEIKNGKVRYIRNMVDEVAM